MKIKALVLAAAAACAIGSVFAADSVSAEDGWKPSSRRGELVYLIVSKWGPHVREAYDQRIDSWAKEMGPLFAKASVPTLQEAANAKTFTAMNDALLGKPQALRKTQVQALLGDTATDLVYVPITPCRIFDTRLAGGAIAANTTRDFDVTAVSNYAFQGGDSSDCGGTGSAGSFKAAVINFTVVGPVGGGYITAFPYLATRPLAATLNYGNGETKGNSSIVALDQGASANELSVYSIRQTHLVGDIMGYFIQSAATPLQCTEVEGAAVSFTAGSTANVFAPDCPATYTRTEVQCRPSNFGLRVVGSWTSHCNFINEGAGAASATAASRCCRVPGR